MTESIRVVAWGVGKRGRRDQLQRDRRKTEGGSGDSVPYLNCSDVLMSVNISQNLLICTGYCMSTEPQKKSVPRRCRGRRQGEEEEAKSRKVSNLKTNVMVRNPRHISKSQLNFKQGT